MTRAFEESTLEQEEAVFAHQEAVIVANIAQQQEQLRLIKAQRAQLESACTPIPVELLSSQFNQPPFSIAPTARQDGRPGPMPPNGGHMAHLGPQPPAPYQTSQFTPMMKRVRTCHTEPQHSVPSQTVGMTRSKSSVPASSCPFTPGSGNGVVKPIPTPQAQASMDRYLDETEQQQPASSNLLNYSMNNVMGAQHRKSDLAPVFETSSTMENPGAWLQRIGHLDVPTNLPSIPVQGQSFQTPVGYQSFTPQDLSTPYGSLTSGPTMSDSAMTRSNSTANQSVTDPFQMMRLSSASSMSDIMPPPDTLSKKRPAPRDCQLLGISSSAPPVPFAGAYLPNMGRSISIDSRLSQGYVQQSPHKPLAMDRRASMQDNFTQRMMSSQSPLSRQSPGGCVVPGEMGGQGEPMMRSVSSSSAQSTMSQRDRAKDSLQRQIQAAGSQVLAPKPKVDPANPESDAQTTVKAGTDGKVAVPKNTYQRPRRPKVVCPDCNEHPNGFRGEHELRRHRDAKHGSMVKKWVCVDPATKGETIEVPPITPFANCKTCVRRKPYGQYYNAAAHLRRSHFKKKVPRASRSKNDNGNDEPVEKRGGKGGGDWPPMNELKKWMEEVVMNQDDVNDATTVSDDEDVADLENDGDFDVCMNAPPGPFDDNAAFGVGSNGNLQVEDNEVYSDNFNDFGNYITSSVQYDPNMMPSTGSANFDFNSPMTANPGFPHDLSIDLSAFQSPHVSSSTATLTPYHSFVESSQFTQGSSQPTTMTMSQPSQQDVLGDMTFDIAITGNVY